MNTQKTFCNSDRYTFDFNMCSYKKGFAQIETTEDASYFGNWINFKSLELVTYCEGDLTIIKCENVKEFKEQLLKTVSWFKKNKSFIGIDLMCSDEIKKDFNNLNLDKNYYLYE
jgi:tRNA G10  N-methylase Trm11